MTEPTPAEIRRARHAVIRGIAIWTPLLIAFAALAAWLLVRATEGHSGAWVTFAISALIGLLTGFSALQAWRDLFAEPITSRGCVARKWRKSDMFVFRGHYVLLERRVLRLPTETYYAMPEPGAWIEALHFPHTNALLRWEPIANPENVPEEPDADDAQEAPAPADGPPARPSRPADAPPPARVEPPVFGRDRDAAGPTPPRD